MIYTMVLGLNFRISIRNLLLLYKHKHRDTKRQRQTHKDIRITYTSMNSMGTSDKVNECNENLLHIRCNVNYVSTMIIARNV